MLALLTMALLTMALLTMALLTMALVRTSVPLKSMSCWSVMRELRSDPSWIAVMRTNSSSMFTIARFSP